jgi:hypothetical protein
LWCVCVREREREIDRERGGGGGGGEGGREGGLAADRCWLDEGRGKKCWLERCLVMTSSRSTRVCVFGC